MRTGSGLRALLAVASIAATFAGGPQATAALLSHWAFDEGSEQTATDSTGYSNGTLGSGPGSDTRDPSWTSAAKIGDWALSYSNDYVNMNAAVVPATGDFTATGWLKTAVEHHDGTMIGQGHTGLDRLIFYGTRAASDDKARVYLGGGQLVISDTKTNDQEWHHVAFTRSGNAFELYVDGVREDTRTRAVTVSSENTYVGMADNGTNYGFQGAIDDVAIWDNKLSSAQVKVLHGLGDTPGFGYNASQVQQLLDLYDAGTGTLRVGDYYWSCTDALDGYDHDLGAISKVGHTYVIPLATDGTGLRATQDLIGHWAFDDGGGPAAIDSTGHSDGTLGSDPGSDARDPSWVTAAKVGSAALDFAGDDYVQTNDVLIPDTGPFTTMGWVRVETANHDGTLMGQGDATTEPGRMLFYGTRSSNDDKARVYLGADQLVISDTKTNDFEWHHLAFTRSGDSFKLYVDGVEEDSNNRSVAVTAMNTFIGRGDSGSSYGFNGLIDDPAVWNRTLSGTEVKATFGVADTAALGYNASQAQRLFDLYEQGGTTTIGERAWSKSAGLGGAAGDVLDLGGGDYAVVLDAAGNGVKSWTGLVGHWTFDDGAGQAASDAAGGNHARLGRLVGADTADPTWVGQGKVGGCLSFDGGDYADTEAIVFPETDDFTAVGWIKTSQSHNGVLFGQGDPLSGYNRLLIYGIRPKSDDGTYENIPRLYMGTQVVHGTTPVIDDEWHLVAFTREGDTYRCYLDGVMEHQRTLGNRIIPASDAVTDCTILGMGDNGTLYGFRGQLDDLGIWNLALSDAEVMALFTLADDPILSYDLGLAQVLFDIHHAGGGGTRIGSCVWQYAEGLATDLGVLTSPDGMHFSLRLDESGTGLVGVIPEPATLSLLALGAVGLLARRRRKR